ncbi:MAG: VOC family protein [Saprospiraceae bacterium]
MKPECVATIFHVANVEASINYYTTVLGFKQEFRYHDLAGMEYGNVLIYLSGPGQDVKRMIGQGSVYIFCDEVDLYYADISTKGALIDVPMDDRPYDMRDFAIKDPDGNIITFGVSIKG